MARWAGRLIALLLLCGVVLFPAIRWPSLGGVDRDTATITSYVADSTVSKDGRITVTETLRVNFPDYKHGIFRFFDVQDPNDSPVRLVPHAIQVSRDGLAFRDPLTNVAGFWVHRSSAPWLEGLLAVVGFALVAAAAATGWTIWRRRRGAAPQAAE